jgi:two-component system, OmpR family, response regulator
MEQKIKLLLAEDDENLGLLLKEYLMAKGYDASLYPDGEAAFKGFTKDHFDICILDIMMPKKDGFTLAKEIRMISADIPIIFLTAKNLKDDVIEGFKLGADDYITKPFSMEELIFRIEAILRRTVPESQNSGQQIFNLGRFTFDTRKQTLSNGENVVKLTTKEADLLKLLCQNTNKVLERNFALKSIWIDDNYFNARSMDVYITKLRKHLKDEPGVEIINVHGKGYKLIM